jgi:hypothetical protein
MFRADFLNGVVTVKQVGLTGRTCNMYSAGPRFEFRLRLMSFMYIPEKRVTFFLYVIKHYAMIYGGVDIYITYS